MRVTHPDSRRTLLVGLVALALTVMALALPAQLSDATFNIDLFERSASPPAQVVDRSAPAAPLEDPMDSPLMRWMR
jgi:hypothetical protein